MDISQISSVLQSSGALSSSNATMIQSLQTNAENTSSGKGLSTQNVVAIASANNDLSMLQSLWPDSGSGVSGLLQSIYNINSQSNATALSQALQNASSKTTEDDPAAQDTILTSLLQPQTDTATDTSQDAIVQSLTSDSSTTADTSSDDAFLQSLLQADSTTSGDQTAA
jgi:hypothetical protein